MRSKTKISPFSLPTPWSATKFILLSKCGWKINACIHSRFATLFYWTKAALRQHGATVAIQRGWKNLELVRNASRCLQVSRHWTSQDKRLRHADKHGQSWNKRRREDVLCTFIIVFGSEELSIRNKFHKIWRDASVRKGYEYPMFNFAKWTKF